MRIRKVIAIVIGMAVFWVSTIGTSYAEEFCTFEHVSVPLNDLGSGEYLRMTFPAPYTYLPTGYYGGLYPGGSNSRPPAHEAAGLGFAAEIRPRDSSGNPSANGKIGLASIGMSNTSSEFKKFSELANSDPTKNPKVVLVNGAKSGGIILNWIDPSLPEYAMYWGNLNDKVIAAGLTDAQVQVLWVKITQIDEHSFPQNVQIFESRLETLMQLLRNKFPNLKVTYVSSRTRSASYTNSAVNEPSAFENGLGVKWLIEKQINGDPNLNYDPAVGSVLTSYLSWGPYLWIDGDNPRSDGRTWPVTNLTSDCVHPSAAGNLAVAQMLLEFFKSDTTATPWFLSPVVPTSTPTPTSTPGPSPTPTQAPSPTPTSIPGGDTQPPIVDITNPANGAIVSTNSTVNIQAAASDNIGVTRVDFYVSGKRKCQDTTAPYECAWTVPANPATHTIQARAFDAQGNNSSSQIAVTSSN